MKTKTIRDFFFIAMLFGGAWQCYCQGTFRNLSFENPILPLNPDASFTVPITNALPGWSGYVGGSQIDRVVYNTVSLGAPAVSFHGPGSPYSPFDGSYLVILQVQVPGGFPGAAIGQTGQIPLDARSVIFYADNVKIAVTFAGQPVTTLDLGVAGGPGAYHKFVGDMAGFAGQTGELLFTAVNSSGSLDFIQFSNQPLPEPSVFGLFALGALVLRLLAGWRKAPS